MTSIISIFKQSLAIELTPAGVWEWDSTNQAKRPIDPYRSTTASWDSYPNDNMAKHFLTGNYLVVDIDGLPVEHDTTTGTWYIPSLELTLPETFYTTTTQPDKYHLYYSVPADTIQTRVKMAKLDLFTYGVIFEGHPSPHNEIHDNPVAPATVGLLKLFEEASNSTTYNTNDSRGVRPHSNIQRYNIVTKFLTTPHDEYKNVDWFAFFTSICARSDLPEGKRKLRFDNVPFSYTLINNIATKLVATAELGLNEHVIPAINMILTSYGKDPTSQETQQRLHKQILATLPTHDPIEEYSLDKDTLTFQEHLNNQSDTTTPLFAVIDGGVKYIEIDKMTQEPVLHNTDYLILEQSAKLLHPERNIIDNSGKVVAWDNRNIPIVGYQYNPYCKQIEFDEKRNRYIVNLFTPSKYIKDVVAKKANPATNLILKALASIVTEEYMPIVLNYHAQMLFGHSSMNMVLWMASLPTDEGGTGKSLVTSTLLSKISGGAIRVIDEKALVSGWGDIITQVKGLILEDLVDTTQKEWDLLYSVIKKNTTSSTRTLNMKGGKVQGAEVDVSLGGSSNFRPRIPPSDRRFFCLEPAHLRGITEPLSPVEARELDMLMKSKLIEPQIQEYANHLAYIYSLPMEEDMYTNLFIRSPKTMYHSKWVSGGATNTQNIVHLLPHPKDLLDMIKIDDANKELVRDLFSMVVIAYNDKTSKSAVSWEWFKHVLPLVQSDKYSNANYSKHTIAVMLQIDFVINVGAIYSDKWRAPAITSVVPQDWTQWAVSGYVFHIECIEEYKDLIEGLTIPYTETHIEGVA